MLLINRLISGGIITNYNCTSSCAHCLYKSGPKREKKYISYDDALQFMQKIRSLGVYSIHVGGGEPFLDFEGLKKVAQAAIDSDMLIEYIETNSSWHKSEEKTVEMLQELRKLNVSTLLLSISPFHNEYIPLQKVKSVISACRKTGMNIFPWIPEFIRDIEHFDEKKIHALEEYDKAFGSLYVQELQYKYHLNIRGRALETFSDFHPKFTAEEILDKHFSPCMALENINHFHIDLYGNYIPGLCTGLAIDVNDLGSETDTGKYPFISVLHEKGINGFYNLAVEKYGYSADAKNFISECHLCEDIRRFLVRNKIKSADLQPESFYS